MSKIKNTKQTDLWIVPDTNYHWRDWIACTEEPKWVNDDWVPEGKAAFVPNGIMQKYLREPQSLKYMAKIRVTSSLDCEMQDYKVHEICFQWARILLPKDQHQRLIKYGECCVYTHLEVLEVYYYD